MREIKFRGKNSAGWVFGALIMNPVYTAIIEIEDPDEGTSVRHYVIPATVGQFTGLKDCEGREVYEGDILVNPNYVQDVRVIEWRDYQWSMVSYTHPFQATVPMIWIGGYKVCGNVHDNPDLLEVEHDRRD